MGLAKPRLTVRSLMIGVAVVAANLAAALSCTAEKMDFTPGFAFATTGGRWGNLEIRDSAGVACLYEGPFRRPDGMGVLRLCEVWRAPPEPWVLNRCAPFIGSASLTLLLLVRPTGVRLASRHRGESDRARPGWARALLASFFRYGLFVLALIALNLACASYRPEFDVYKHDTRHPADARHADFERSLRDSARSGQAKRTAHTYRLGFMVMVTLPGQGGERIHRQYSDVLICKTLGYADLFVGPPKVLNIAVDGTLVERCAMELEGPCETTLPDVIFQNSPNGEATLDFLGDGSIVSFVGRPGRLQSPPRVIRAPLYSPAAAYWPAVAGAIISAAAALPLLRRLTGRRFLIVIAALLGVDTGTAWNGIKIPQRPSDQRLASMVLRIS